jgi:hypothetical protein
MHIFNLKNWGGEEKEQEETVISPKLQSQKNFIFNGQKKGKKTRRIFFSRLKSHKTKCKVINVNKRRKPKRKIYIYIYLFIYSFIHLFIYI